MTMQRQRPEFISGGNETEASDTTHWRCGKCSFTFTAPTLPKECPECKEKCDFKNITCYTPECGGAGNIDPRL